MWDGQFSVQPGVRIALSAFDLACYATVPLDSPLGGDALAVGVQVLRKEAR
jgi:hypothetical protein